MIKNIWVIGYFLRNQCKNQSNIHKLSGFDHKFIPFWRLNIKEAISRIQHLIKTLMHVRYQNRWFVKGRKEERKRGREKGIEEGGREKTGSIFCYNGLNKV